MKNNPGATINTILAYLFPNVQDAFFIAILFAISVQGPMLLNADGDLGRHITIGNYISETGKIPTSDIFSHTMYGEKLVPHEWLAQWVFSRAHATMGLNGIVLLISVLIATTFTLTYREIRKRNSTIAVAFIVAALAAFASSLHWLARPHVFTFLFVALWTYLLAGEKSKVWYFPAIMLFWANTHGAFITGFAIWFAHLTGWAWDYMHGESDRKDGIRLGIIGLSSLAVTFINPVGWDLWSTSAGYYGNQFLVNSTVEYLSPNFHNWSTWPFLIMLAVCLVGIGLNVKLKTYEAFLLAGWTMLSLYSARNIPLFAIITAPYVGTIIQTILPQPRILQRIENAINSVEKNHRGIILPILAVAFLASTFVSQKGVNTANTFDPDKFPVRAVDWLKTNPQEGKMFNNFIWGGYILYRMFPQELVFIDGQTDFYGETLTREYAQVTSLDEGWQEILKRNNVSWVIIQSDKPLIPALQSELNWKVVYQDNTATILHKP